VQKTGSGGFLENPRLCRFSSGSQQAENMIKVPENGREGVRLCRSWRKGTIGRASWQLS